MSAIHKKVQALNDDAKIFDLLIKFGLALVFAGSETKDAELEYIDCADVAKRSVAKADAIVKALDAEMSKLDAH